VGNSFRLPNATDGRPMPADVKLVHINANPADLNKRYHADVSILADAKLALRELIDAVRDRLGPGRGGVREEVVAEVHEARSRWMQAWMPTMTDASTPTNGYRAVYDLQQVVDLDKTIAIHDAGGSRGYVSPFWPATRPRSYVGMGGMAAMGWSMGAAIGAKLGRPDHLVFNVLGDSSFGMVGMELETAVRMKLPTLTLVLNNGGIGGSLMAMDSPSAPPATVVELGGDFAAVARGLGAYSERVEDPGGLVPAYKRAIQATEGGQAALVEVMIKPLPTPELPDTWQLGDPVI
jgi:acetolactate synthase-1/2/3 large subunit